MRRLLEQHVIRDLDHKIVLLTGPRQVGKTTLSKALWTEYDSFNHDLAEHRP